jgi:NADH-quinone oxidoreductase subunit D
MAAERLAGVEVPKRAEYCRVLATEFSRIHSHLLSFGSMAMDIGASTPFTHAIREREYINDLLEELCGARLTFNYMRIGGVAWDLPPAWREKALAYVDRFEPFVDEWNTLISYNKIYTERLANVAVITPEQAVDWNLVGPNLRGSGVKFDVRKDEPYSIYPEIDFDVPIGHGEVGTVGDCFDRYIVRMNEMRESCRIIRQCLQQLPPGPVIAKVARNFKPPAGDCYVRVESARGDMGWYVVSDGTAFPYRCKIRTGSFSAISIIQPVSRNLMIADLIAVIASLDLVAPEIDR